jgi:hypothetical protein
LIIGAKIVAESPPGKPGRKSVSWRGIWAGGANCLRAILANEVSSMNRSRHAMLAANAGVVGIGHYLWGRVPRAVDAVRVSGIPAVGKECSEKRREPIAPSFFSGSDRRGRSARHSSNWTPDSLDALILILDFDCSDF